MNKNRKGQAAIEFLSTYGWVLIVLLLALGILANYGLLNPSKYLPDKADFGNQLKVEEYFLDYDANGDGSNNPVLGIKLRNNFARAINITNMTVKKDGQQFEQCKISETSVAVGEDVLLACTNLELNKNVKNKFYIEIGFQRNATGAPEHTISGMIFTEPVEGNYCSLTEEGTPLYQQDNNDETTNMC
jgi:hypothetical protein